MFYNRVIQIHILVINLEKSSNNLLNRTIMYKEMNKLSLTQIYTCFKTTFYLNQWWMYYPKSINLG